VKQRSFGLILLDVTMGDIDGYVVCQQLKSHPDTRTIPVVFVTGLESDSDREKGLAVGASGYLLKPIKRQAVLTCVQQQLHSRTR